MRAKTMNRMAIIWLLSIISVVSAQTVTQLMLINADTDQQIGVFSNGTTLNLATLPTKNLSIRADVSGTVGSVRFGYDGNASYSTENNAPYAIAGDANGNYNPWTPTVGSHTVTATAYSGTSATGSAGATVSVSFTVVNNTGTNQAPTASLTSPSSGATFTAPATISMTASASDADGSIAKVEFYQGTTLLGTATASPYAYSWTNVGAGTYGLSAKAFDNAGATTTSSTISVTVGSGTNPAPVVTFTKPTNGQSFGAPANVQTVVTATDANGTIANVKLYKNGVLVRQEGTAPYEWLADAALQNLSAGTYTLRADATDNAGAIGSATVTITVGGGANQVPTVSLTSPSSGATFTAPATVPMTASASDADGSIAKVEFYQGTTLLGTATASPYAYTWTSVGAGSYSLSAKAFDNAGATTTSSTISVTVGSGTNPAPVVTFTKPTNGQTFTAPANVQNVVTATDANGTVANVKLYKNGVFVRQEGTAPYEWLADAALQNLPAGTYTLRADATDNAGAIGSATVTITVGAGANQAPTVSLTSPSSGATFTAPAAISLTASASDADGSITKVEFYRGTTLLGTATASPYAYSWTNVGAGSYSLSAKAFDNSGAVTMSATSTISVIVPGQAPQVQQWHPYDLTFTTSASYANPFQNVTMSATFSGPGVSLTIPAFHNGGTSWTVRFAPTVQGTWTYTTTSSDAQLNGRTGSISCIANTQSNVHGKLGINTSYRHHFKFEDGTPYFLLGGEIDWLGLMGFSDDNITKEKQIIDMYVNNGFNQVMMDIYAHNVTWGGNYQGTSWDFGPPTAYPFAGTNSSPDHTRMNPAFFNHYDKVINYLFQKGVVAHLYFKVFTKQVNYPSNRSTNDLMFWKYITARYQAYPNIIWDFAKESQGLGDNTYKKDMINLVKSNDAYRRLITTHDDNPFYADASCAATVDFHTEQYHVNQGSLYSFAVAERSKNWPFYNAEYGYHWGPGGSSDQAYVPGTSSQSCNAEDMLKRTYELVMAGGYACYYYTYHSWDIVKYSETPTGLSYYKHLSNLFNKTNWYACSPQDNLLGSASGKHCLANAGKEYLVYFSAGGSTTLSISGATSTLNGRWINAYTGAEQSAGTASNGTPTFSAPWSTPCVLWLTTASLPKGEAVEPARPATPHLVADSREVSSLSLRTEHLRIELTTADGRMAAVLCNEVVPAGVARSVSLTKTGMRGMYFARVIRDGRPVLVQSVSLVK